MYANYFQNQTNSNFEYYEKSLRNESSISNFDFNGFNNINNNDIKINKAFGMKLNPSEQLELDKNTQNRIDDLSLKR